MTWSIAPKMPLRNQLSLSHNTTIWKETRRAIQMVKMQARGAQSGPGTDELYTINHLFMASSGSCSQGEFNSMCGDCSHINAAYEAFGTVSFVCHGRMFAYISTAGGLEVSYYIE